MSAASPNITSIATRLMAGAAATLGWFALALQLYLALHYALANGRPIWSGLLSYFGFFTVLTNILVAALLTARACGAAETSFLGRPDVKAAAAVYIVIVAVVYALLLQHLWTPQGPQWLADALLHYAMPAIYLGYWLAAVRKGTLRWVSPVAWLAYPSIYFLASLLRGALTGRYPYPFLDLNTLGLARLAANAAGLMAVFVAVGLLVVALDRAMGRRSHSDQRRGGTDTLFGPLRGTVQVQPGADLTAPTGEDWDAASSR